MFTFFFAFFGSFDIYAELITQVISELKFFALDVRIDLVCLLFLGTALPYILLQIAKEEKALAELNVLVQCLGKTVTDLLQVKVAQRRCNLLRVETVAQVPGLVSLGLVNQRVPFLILFWLCPFRI